MPNGHGVVLGFDTSGPWCGCALIRCGRILAESNVDMAKGQAERLFPCIESLLSKAGLGWKDIGRIGVGTGPGNFTGIRISVSSARGLAMSLGIGAVGVSCFDALAYGSNGPVLCAIHAPQGRVYVQGMRMKVDLQPRMVAIEDMPSNLNEPGLTCLGSAGAMVSEKLGCARKSAAFPTALAIARIADERRYGDDTPPSPLYLKPADARPFKISAPVMLDETREASMAADSDIPASPTR
ncbi:MAG: tRNA (adenosine(37)-N6)-threonylcarbamoyltransferase complex dimerization subunit type 1 TsaB [Roseovarius sp.]|nr:tRNA (adenosine(37)-N6)-threonylcarbamoyltransferase complex dimerization subunit type 1 TsaB [Roseovarius sp.]